MPKVIYLTWMFPTVGITRPEKRKPDSLDFALKLAKVGTAPLQKSAAIVRLRACPYFDDRETCPLSHKIKIIEKDQKLLVERLKYPVKACRLTNFYRCPFLKPYYYTWVLVK